MINDKRVWISAGVVCVLFALLLAIIGPNESKMINTIEGLRNKNLNVASERTAILDKEINKVVEYKSRLELEKENMTRCLILNSNAGTVVDCGF